MHCFKHYFSVSQWISFVVIIHKIWAIGGAGMFNPEAGLILELLYKLSKLFPFGFFLC